MAVNPAQTPGNAMVESRVIVDGALPGRSAFQSVTASTLGVDVDWSAFIGGSGDNVDFTAAPGGGVILRKLVVNNCKNQSTIFVQLDESGVSVPVGAFVPREWYGFSTRVPLKIIEGDTGGEEVVIEAYYDPATVTE